MLQYHLNEEVDLSSRKTSFIDASVDWIATHFKIGDQTRIADFGCGPGLYASRLARRHAQVTGIDFSARSIAYAREAAQKEGQKIRFIHENYLSYETDDTFDLIIMIMCDFCALSLEQRALLLRKFSKLLRPGGAVLLDVYSMSTYHKREEAASYEANQLNGFWTAEPYYGFLNIFKYDKEHVVLDQYTIVTEDEIKTVYNWLQYFSIEALKEEFEANGLQIEETYANVAGAALEQESPEIAVVARRP
jgi:SAM-dependent methyltransferase